MLHTVAPKNHTLAELAVQAQPESAEAWFWLAGALTYISSAGSVRPVNEHDREWVIRLYRQGLYLAPHDGQRWRELGDLLASQNPQAAIEAYLQSCYNGDPGLNGCYRAGATAAHLGDFDAAIQYYRLSRLSESWKRADQLEQQLRQQTPP